MKLHPSEETHKWPHSKTMRMTQSEIHTLENWLQSHDVHHVSVIVRRRAYTSQTKQYAVVVSLRDLHAWPAFVLAWC